MGLKKRSKVSAEFSMSSLTDIIFLLLIFFMLTSSLVSPNALNLRLPGDWSKHKPTDLKPDELRISGSSYYLNGDKQSISQVDRNLKKMARAHSKGKMSLLIAPDRKAPVEDVVAVMDIARRYNINGILVSAKN